MTKRILEIVAMYLRLIIYSDKFVRVFNVSERQSIIKAFGAIEGASRD